MTQLYPGIRRKLQKMEGFLDLTSIQMTEIADEVFVSWDQETIKRLRKNKRRVIEGPVKT